MTTQIKDLLKKEDSEYPFVAFVRGWVKTCRAQGKMTFIELTDGSCNDHLQLVYKGRTTASTGCGLEATGNVKLSPAKGQRVEMFVSELKTYPHDSSTPIAKINLSDDVLRAIPHLRTKTAQYAEVARERHRTMMRIHEFMDKEGFFCIHTPLITTSDCEGAGEAFHVMSGSELTARSASSVGDRERFFKRDAYLTVSGQLHVEASCMALSKVYTFGPTFRAEHSKTSRHLAEFWMVEPEMICSSLDELLDFTEMFVRFAVNKPVPKFKRITYTEAVKIIQLASDLGECKESISWGDDLSSEHEKLLTSTMPFVFVTHWPKSLKSFYMLPSKDETEFGKTVDCFDLLVEGVGELIGGSMREYDYHRLLTRMKELGMHIPTYQWYLDLRKYGTLPHGGFGIGFERLLMYLTEKQARDTIQFPRTYQHCDM